MRDFSILLQRKVEKQVENFKRFKHVKNVESLF